MKKVLLSVSSIGTFLLPVVAFAQGVGGGLEESVSGLPAVAQSLTDTVNSLIPFFLAIAVIVFIYGVIKYVLAGGAEDKAAARGFIIYGIIGIAVIVSLFGIITLLQNTLSIDPSSVIQAPQVE